MAAVVCLLASAQLMCTSRPPSPCNVKDDCWNTPESEELGRCAPREVACIRGACRVACAEPCEVIDPEVNSCRDSRLVCTQSKSGDNTFPYCASGPISCTTADECPLSLPQTADGGTGTWSCVDSVCQYPGYSYVWQ
jgi:hypothetical protein